MDHELVKSGTTGGPRRAGAGLWSRPRTAVRLSTVLLVASVTMAGAPVAVGAPTLGDAPVATRQVGAVDRGVPSVGLFPTGASEPGRVRAVDKPYAVRVGTRFKVKVAGYARGVRVYQPRARKSTTPRLAELWSSGGQRLARVRFTPKAGPGWRTAHFSRPVRLQKGSYYTVSAYAPSGVYARTPGGFRHSRSNAYLSAPARLNGLIRTGARAAAPVRRAPDHANFWVDVIFTPRARAGTTDTDSVTPSTVHGCATAPAKCGYPDAGNTGPASLSGLTAVPEKATYGPGWSWNSTYQTIFVSGAHAVLDRLDVHGGVVIDAPDVTLSNSRIAACGGEDDGDVVGVRYRAGSEYQGSGAHILHNQILGTPGGCDHRSRSGVRDVFGEAPDAVVEGNDISGVGNGITLEYSGVISDNWIHDLGHLPGDHHSGISSHGGAAGILIRHNTALLYGQQFEGGGGVSGALTVYADFGHAQNVTMQDNLISGGSYVIYGGESGDSYSRPATNIKILGNRFVCGDWLYGPIAAFAEDSSGNELSGNYCDQDGAPVR